MVRTRSGKIWDGNGNDEEKEQKPGTPTRKSNDQGDLKYADKGRDLNDCVAPHNEFQVALKEGRAERRRLAEEKRLEGLRRIREKNSKTGIDPLEHFPREVWVQILDELCPEGKANIWEVHHLFCSLLERHRIRDVLFPQIIDQKRGLVQKCFENPHTNPGILELRLVSNGTRTAVDKWFEDDLLAMMRRSKHTAWKKYQHDWWDSSERSVNLDITSDEEELAKILKIRKPMRFFKRDLTINDLGEIGWIQHADRRRNQATFFMENVTKVLEQVGDQVWRFEFYCDGNEEYGISRTNVYSFLHEWLHYLPNLKFLDICINWYPFFKSEFEGIPVDKFLTSKRPFPSLPALERLDFAACTADLNIICDAIIAVNPQIKIFSFDQFNNRGREVYMSQPHIQSLNLEVFDLGVPESSWEFKKYEAVVMASNWHLKRMDLLFMAGGTPINSFIKFLNQVPTLEVLFLELDKIIFSAEELEFLRLPNLKHFGIEFETMEKTNYKRNLHFFLSLQFLLHSNKLESLSWGSRNACPSLRRQNGLNGQKNPDEFLGFGGSLKNLCNCSLWDLFPRLKLLQVEIKWTKNATFRKPRGL